LTGLIDRRAVVGFGEGRSQTVTFYSRNRECRPQILVKINERKYFRGRPSGVLEVIRVFQLG
jgi:hypothetical protein